MKLHLLHIPKTGGLTVHRALRQAGLAIKRSHDPAQVPDDADLVITLLRDPVARVVSLYRYQCRLDRFQGSLVEFMAADHDPWYWGVVNVQSRMVETVDRERLLVGWTTILDDLIWQVCAAAAVPYPDDYRSHNVTEGKIPLTEDEQAVIRAANTRDIALVEELMEST